MFHKKLAFVTWFNAGVRAIDIRDPYTPKEVGYFIPPITEATVQRCIKVDGQDRCKIAIQSNNVETDDRGYIYVVDRANTGMHILEVTGEARAIAGFSSCGCMKAYRLVCAGHGARVSVNRGTSPACAYSPSRRAQSAP